MGFLGINWSKKDSKKTDSPHADTGDGKGVISPGRVSVPNDAELSIMDTLKGMTGLVTPSYRTELVPLIRELYKVNPDISIALQDMFKLANTGHKISFPNNSDDESKLMTDHLDAVTKKWSRYTAGIDGLVNKFIVQCLVGGAISVEAVPNLKLNGVSTILFVNPEDIRFERQQDGVYHPYQINKGLNLPYSKTKDPTGTPYIKLNTETFKYVAMFNDIDEPYGVPPFLAALDSLKTQADMRTNLKQIMELMGLLGFLEVTMEKPGKLASESEPSYRRRLGSILKALKQNVREGMKDGVIVGYKDDHEFKLNSTTKNLGGIDKVWSLNQQSVANGLSVNGTLIGVQSTTTEGAAGIILSKLISQLKNIQMLVKDVLDFIYTLELRLAGFNNKGMIIEFTSSTVSDELKIQQGTEYKIRNLTSLYNQGIITQDDFAREMGISSPALKKPRPIVLPPAAAGSTPSPGVSSPVDSAKKKKREKGKDASDRKTRDKTKVVPKRKDQKNV